jgi:hypothetical protein
MAESIESLTTKFDALRTEFSDLGNKAVGSEPIIQKVLDKLSAMETRQLKMDSNVTEFLKTVNNNTARL